MNVNDGNIDDIYYWGLAPCFGSADCSEYESESDLDVQLITGIAPGIKTVLSNLEVRLALFYGSDEDQNTWNEFEGPGLNFLATLYGINSLPEECLPTVASFSAAFILGEYLDRLCDIVETQQGPSSTGIGDDCRDGLMGGHGNISGAGKRLMDVQLALLGLRGTTFVAASGDGGSHFHHSPIASEANGLTIESNPGFFLRSGEPLESLSEEVKDALNSAMDVLSMPLYPAESPYVLSVGGVMHRGNQKMNELEYWNTGGGAGGAGFSFTQPRPQYQDEVVAQYLANDFLSDPNLAAFNEEGRAYVDVSGPAQSIVIIESGVDSLHAVAGTSAATPIVAGVLSLINSSRMKTGLPTLGFFNPRLYKQNLGNGFLDIVNSTLTTATYDSLGGFETAEGWDPSTGFGVPAWTQLFEELVVGDTL
jgi:hypothetical protein